MGERQFIVFALGNEMFGVDIQHIGSISTVLEMSKVPNAPRIVEGVINLRGSIIPIINLKKKFNMSEIPLDERARILIHRGEDRDIGFLVDEAYKVVKLGVQQIQKAPEIVTQVHNNFIKGISNVQEQILIILDFERILETEEKDSVCDLSNQPE